jgi:hypothetical protein
MLPCHLLNLLLRDLEYKFHDHFSLEIRSGQFSSPMVRKDELVNDYIRGSGTLETDVSKSTLQKNSQ